MTKCERCQGKGYIYVLGAPLAGCDEPDVVKDACPVCSGKGYIEETEAEEEAEYKYQQYQKHIDEMWRDLRDDQKVSP